MANITLYDKKEACCGCGACMNICPKNAITMVEDENGFRYPKINPDLCVGCGLCRKACRYQKDLQNRKEMGDRVTNLLAELPVYAAVSEKTDLTQSASGGLFAGIAREFVRQGGIVYGAAMQYEENLLQVRHIAVTEEADLVRLQGSKYVQSDLGNSYAEIKKQLNAGNKVLFTGTPCQVAGLSGYLGREYENLYTLDLICHGVPSQKFFQSYLAHEEKKKKGTIIDFKFRDKSLGWQLMGSMKIRDDQNQVRSEVFEPEKSSYYQLFLNSYTYRENCYHCPYAGGMRPGNLTIGDFWCIELVHPELCAENGGDIDTSKGTSCLIINNKKGQELLNLYGQGIRRWNSSYENAARYNGQLRKPSEEKAERVIVFEKYKEGYDKVERWYHRRLIPIVIRRRIRAMVPRSVKNMIKRMIRR